MPQPASRKNGIFTATVVPDEITIHEGRSGPYLRMRNAVVVTESGRKSTIRTVLAFGGTDSATARLLQPGRPVRLAVRFDGPTLKVVGLPGGDSGRALVASAPDHESISETVRTLYGVLAGSGVPEHDIPTIIAEMIGGTEGLLPDGMPCGDEEGDRLEHLLLPLLAAGTTDDSAIAMSRAIDGTVVGSRLRDLRTMREQASARALVTQ